MGFMDQFNKGGKFDARIPEDFEYRKLEDLYKDKKNKGRVYPVRALFFNKRSQFGSHGVVLTDTCLVDLPKHLNETITDLLASDEVVERINHGNVGFTIYSYNDKNYNKVCYSVKWCDINEA